MSNSLPPEGLCRTTAPMPGKETAVPAGRLYLLRHQSEQGPPVILPPESNTHNRWTFDRRGHLVHDLAWAATLKRVRAEGFYTFKRPLTLDDGRTIHARQIVQLGYNRGAEPIVFFPRWDPTNGNHLVFPDKGMRLTESQIEALEPLDFRGPMPAGA